MLLEIIFMAAVCGANNASVKSRQRNRCQLRRWHWLVAAAASLFVAVARDARLTYWNHERPLDATAKSRSIVHVIGCAIILICDALLVAVLAYALVIAVAFAPHDAAEQAKRVEATRDRLAREKDPVERAVLEKALARDEALLADLKAEAPGALPRAWRPRADAWRALLRGTLRDPTWAPSHLYKEAEQRALLAALIHPPGACPGPFGGHDLAERARDPTKRPRPLQRRAQAIAEGRVRGLRAAERLVRGRRQVLQGREAPAGSSSTRGGSPLSAARIRCAGRSSRPRRKRARSRASTACTCRRARRRPGRTASATGATTRPRGSSPRWPRRGW